MDWTAWRDEFPIFRSKIYLNTCSLGPLARRVRAAHDRFLDEWESLGAAAWTDRWLDAIDGLRSRSARAIGTREEEVAITPSVSVALSSIASTLDYEGRPKVVTSELDFPTVAYQWAVRPGVEEILLPSQDGIAIPAASFEDAVDERTSVDRATPMPPTTITVVRELPRIPKLPPLKPKLIIDMKNESAASNVRIIPTVRRPAAMRRTAALFPSQPEVVRRGAA